MTKDRKSIWILAHKNYPTLPDYNQSIHAHGCFIVFSHKSGAWEFINPKKPWLEIPIDKLPGGTKRCKFCRKDLDRLLGKEP